ncbi:MAG: methionine--tRNA ligase [Candidatus Kerfeldbacteria bacterium]|nr:methionine--tRNA ligase [Candidatus Kerfeldbacteria bacterium]
MERFSVTTPIYYVNDVPHIGHLYSTLIADVLARYWRQKLGNDQVWFSTGTDENSQKTVEAAQKKGLDPQRYTDQLAGIWQQTFERLGISFNDFIRTTEFRHKEAVQALLVDMDDSGDIYQGHYEGWYCVGHEAFMKESELVDGKCPEHNRNAEWLKEENYFFKLSKYEKDLLHWFEKNPDWVVPPSRYNEVKQFVKQGLEDISITRQSQRWGIPLPKDTSHVIYVWIDALINYLTTVGYPDQRYRQWWPSVHVIGKDITKFHCIIWPAMLMSVGIEPPKQVLVNGFFTVNGQKISKSLGNAIEPLALSKKYGSDAVRYFLLREIPFGSDGDFSEDKLKQRYVSDLANGLGNLVSRVTNMLEQFAHGQFVRSTTNSPQQLSRHQSAIEQYRFDEALGIMWEHLDAANQLIDVKAPWNMAKEGKRDELNSLLNDLANRVLNIAGLLEPFMPVTAKRIQKAFVEPVKKAEPLFPR